MAVQRGAGTVIAHRGPRIGVGGGFLDIAQRDPSVQRRGEERVPQGVRPDVLGDLGAAGDAPDDPPAPRRSSRRPSAARKIAPSVRSPMIRWIAQEVRGCQQDGDHLPA